MTREERYIEYDERIDRYLRTQMDDSERTAFEQDVDNNQELRERLVATAMLVKGISQAGMQQEGQAQLDAIKRMSKDEFVQATRGKKNRNPMWAIMKWASGIAAAAIVAYGLYTFYPRSSRQQPKIAKVEKKNSTKQAKSPIATEPTLAGLADKYNESFSGEPDKFAEIRKQIHKNGSKDMMAVVYDIDQIEWPTSKHEPKGAADEEEFKETQQNYDDCTHWYKALAYLKAGERESAVKELNELIDHGTIEELVNRATDLLEKLKE